MVKINLGSGRKLLKGFINVDIGYDFKDKNFVKADVRELPFKDNYADYILARQVLEHIHILNIPNTLQEWVRVLRPKGRMVITCPNFELMAADFLNAEFDITSYYEMTQGLYGNQLTDYEIHLSPITPKLLGWYLQKLPVKGTIKSYPKGSPAIQYPGYENMKGRVLRYGEVHCDLRKND